MFRAALIAIVASMLACATVSPTPDPTPPPSPDAAVDIFTGATIDCSVEFTNPPVDLVRTCADVTNTDSCLADLVAGTTTADVVGCTARGLDMSLHVGIARGTANDTMKAEAAAIDRWFRTHNISVRE